VTFTSWASFCNTFLTNMLLFCKLILTAIYMLCVSWFTGLNNEECYTGVIWRPLDVLGSLNIKKDGRVFAQCVWGPGFHPQHCKKQNKHLQKDYVAVNILIIQVQLFFKI
jgi:hypothetical protein